MDSYRSLAQRIVSYDAKGNIIGSAQGLAAASGHGISELRQQIRIQVTPNRKSSSSSSSSKRQEI